MTQVLKRRSVRAPAELDGAADLAPDLLTAQVETGDYESDSRWLLVPSAA
jgi:hypothetical protein